MLKMQCGSERASTANRHFKKSESYRFRDDRFRRSADGSEEEREEKEEDSSFVEGDELDVEELVRNELIVQWPIRVLCKDDCKGICSRCGANLNIQTCDCDTTGLDPRMAAIKDIVSSFSSGQPS